MAKEDLIAQVNKNGKFQLHPEIQMVENLDNDSSLILSLPLRISKKSRSLLGERDDID